MNLVDEPNNAKRSQVFLGVEMTRKDQVPALTVTKPPISSLLSPRHSSGAPQASDQEG